ncbi:DUF2865 domain-containing protein [Aquibium sp. A9E412]|uniref:DUF2865 domain-containing protein n=1 Tax=Aquibium sp. A9E412 TaxID=2976767 RepID=UPI0025B1374E|nr:DUF2865 domain-containing protein [Aquibium sp. A9E412]MDN2567850.1 DUF2865 domain-containing protein [Aquibium sp. A9E412]
MSGLGDRLLRAAAIAACLFALGAGPAAAQSCADLAARLAAVPPTGGSAQLARFERAVAAQAAALQRARADARRTRCGGLFSAGGPACKTLSATIARMERNLRALERQRDNLAAGRDPQRERREIRAAQAAAGCLGEAPRATVARAAPEPQRRRAAADRPAATQSVRRVVITDGPRGDPAGRYRTLCVRTCDGYYFPISYAVPASAFARDALICRQRCPGSDTALYIHRVPGEDTEAMVAAGDGTPYTALPAAFAYRDRAPGAAACGCGAARAAERGFSVIAGDTVAPPADREAGLVLQSEATMPAVAPVPEAAEPQAAPVDPQAVAATLRRTLADPLAARPAERRVRVVAPAFLPGPEAAEDRPAPAPTDAR